LLFAQSVTLRGYTAACALGKSARNTSSKRKIMSRLVLLVVLVVLVIGGLYFLSTLPKEQPPQTIEVAVPQGTAAGGNAH
jgi:flagellar basal body-associated protein FliL